LQKHFHNSTIFDKFQQETKQRSGENKKIVFILALFLHSPPVVDVVDVVVAVRLLFLFSFSRSKPKKVLNKITLEIRFFFSFLHKVHRKKENVRRRGKKKELLVSLRRNMPHRGVRRTTRAWSERKRRKKEVERGEKSFRIEIV
jgi:hypothetical protein